MNVQDKYSNSHDNSLRDTEVTYISPSKKNTNPCEHFSLTFNTFSELSISQCTSARVSEVSVSTRVLNPNCTQLDTNTYHSDELTGSISLHNISKGSLPSDGFNVFNNTPSPVEGGKLNEFTKLMGETSYSVLKNLRVKNINRFIIAHINSRINSIRKKFDTLTDLVTGTINILLFSETKINDSFPSAQFKMPGYTSPYRLDRTNDGGGLLLYIREDIPSKLLDTANVISDINFESLFVEINLSKSEWLIYGNIWYM